MPASARAPSSVRIRNATLVTQDESRRVVQGDLRIEGSRIVEVATPAAHAEADVTLDGTGQVVLPGLVNLHTHLAMGLLRGYGDDMRLEPWLQDRIWPAEARIDSAAMVAGAELGLLEMIRGGTTSFLDMYFLEEEAMLPAARKAGVRSWLGEGMVDVGQTDPGQPNRKLAGIERFVKATQAAKDPTVTPCPAPHGTYTCNPETYVEAARISQEHGVPLHTHCSETRTEVYDVVGGKTPAGPGPAGSGGRRPVGHLQATGALGSRSVLAHCGWITKEEVGAIAAAHAAVAHCPVSNLKLATGGVTPVPELQAAGAKVGLGTDGSASNNTLDMFETMKFAALVQKQHRWDPTVLPAQRVLDMATRDGADALHRSDLGRLVPGATADVVMVDFRRPHLVPRFDAVSHLVYAAGAQDVSATIVHGRPLMSGGQVHTLDEAAVLAAAQAAAERIVKA